MTGHTQRVEADCTVEFVVNGDAVEVSDDGATLLDALRVSLGHRSVKDGCSPQGQCGCCTVLVDGQPRVSCVTPVRRVAGRTVTTFDGLPADEVARWESAFCTTGGSQCGFCTPGIAVRFAGLLAASPDDPPVRDRAARALYAHLCRCTGWQTVLDAWDRGVGAEVQVDLPRPATDLGAAARRATIEGRSPQVVGPDVVRGRGGFAADTAPDGHLVAVPRDGIPDGRWDDPEAWVVADALAEARRLSGKVQGRRTTAEVVPPLEAPTGDWDAVLRTCWVEPAPLETDSVWCEPGGKPVGPLANGGAFGAKAASPLSAVARALADRHGRPVLLAPSREDTVRYGAKRPPVGGGARADGTGVLRVARTPGIAEAVATVAPGLEVIEVDVAGPPTSATIRAAGWAEAIVLLVGAGAMEPGSSIWSPDGAEATAIVETVGDRTGIRVVVRCGEVLDEVVLRSYCVGAAHMAWSWITSEGLSVDGDGTVHDLTIRSFGIVRAAETPTITVEMVPDGGGPVNGSDAVFAAVAAATWRHLGCPSDLPGG
ncbi:MAG: 2Fe-2S iron-sulfur cluster-binding protein [Actinomycetota bacterium]|nr:2Fe-2S iron-sulfur cluster-binding protein [Actinomycetota bacterium]